MEDITCKELKERLDKSEELFIVDVREVDEYEEFNINALNIPLSEFADRYNELKDHKEKELIIHCRAGGRSANAKSFLEDQGYTQVRNLLGGMMEWQELNDA